VLASTGGPEAGGGLPPLDVEQDAVATDAGVKVRVTRAAFSGTATFVELVVDASGAELADGTVLRISSAALEQSRPPLPPGVPELLLLPGHPTIVRLLPPTLGVQPVLRITSMLGVAPGQESVTLAGRWELPLTVPNDLAARVRVEHLSPASVADSGVEVSVVGAVRSTSETLVTIHVESDDSVAGPLEHLGQPVVLAAGKRLYGGIVAKDEDGRLWTIAFPPTEFGGELQVVLGPFLKRDTSQAGEIALDLAAVLDRNDFRGSDQDAADVLPGDIIAESGAGLEVRAVRVNGSISGYGADQALEFLIRGAYPDFGAFIVVGPDGSELRFGPNGYGYSKDSTGAISSPRTELSVLFDSIDELRGIVTIRYDGRIEETIDGSWMLTLSPAD
jgi:hypothetical protein